MVLLHMKSTTDKDEWLYSAPMATETDVLIPELVAILNTRTRLKAQLLALWNLRNEDEGKHMEGRTEEEKALVQGLYEKSRAVTHVDRVGERKTVELAELEAYVAENEAAAKSLFPQTCGQADSIDALHKSREDPDTKEDDRLRAWYFLELIDPFFKERDFLDKDKAQLWWAGKVIARGRVLSEYTGRNEKSKAVCKLAAADKGCPAREASMGHEEQRALRKHFEQKRDTFKTLDASELADHKNVRRKPGDFVAYAAPTSTGKRFFGDGSRAAVDTNAAAGGDGLIKLNTNVRHIHHASRTETECDVAP